MPFNKDINLTQGKLFEGAVIFKPKELNLDRCYYHASKNSAAYSMIFNSLNSIELSELIFCSETKKFDKSLVETILWIFATNENNLEIINAYKKCIYSLMNRINSNYNDNLSVEFFKVYVDIVYKLSRIVVKNPRFTNFFPVLTDSYKILYKIREDISYDLIKQTNEKALFMSDLLFNTIYHKIYLSLVEAENRALPSINYLSKTDIYTNQRNKMINIWSLTLKDFNLKCDHIKSRIKFTDKKTINAFKRKINRFIELSTDLRVFKFSDGFEKASSQLSRNLKSIR